MKILFSYKFLIPTTLLLGLAPFFPPHILEKMTMLMAGTLRKPVDIFDLVWHAWPIVLLAYRFLYGIANHRQKIGITQASEPGE